MVKIYKCPECNTELDFDNNAFLIEKDNHYLIKAFTCANPECDKSFTVEYEVINIIDSNTGKNIIDF